MSSRTRSFAALIALVSLLFAQLAVAAYACPVMGGVAQVPVAPHEEGGCGGTPMDPEQPWLCHAHSQQGGQALEKPSVWVPDQVGFIAIPGSLRDLHRPHAVAAVVLPSLLARATAPPAALRNCCLRI